MSGFGGMMNPWEMSMQQGGGQGSMGQMNSMPGGQPQQGIQSSGLQQQPQQGGGSPWAPQNTSNFNPQAFLQMLMPFIMGGMGGGMFGGQQGGFGGGPTANPIMGPGGIHGGMGGGLEQFGPFGSSPFGGMNQAWSPGQQPQAPSSNGMQRQAGAGFGDQRQNLPAQPGPSVQQPFGPTPPPPQINPPNIGFTGAPMQAQGGQNIVNPGNRGISPIMGPRQNPLLDPMARMAM